MSFMPNPGSLVILTSGENALVSKVTPDGKDDRVIVVRVSNGVVKHKEVRITPHQIAEVLRESE